MLTILRFLAWINPTPRNNGKLRRAECSNRVRRRIRRLA